MKTRSKLSKRKKRTVFENPKYHTVKHEGAESAVNLTRVRRGAETPRSGPGRILTAAVKVTSY